MAQLIMKWRNDFLPIKEVVIPNDVKVKTFPEMDNAIDEWIKIERYIGWGENPEPITDPDYYKKEMLDHENYNENMCFFILVDEVPAASITVICDYEKRDGYIHMVACKPEYRGRRLGHLMNEIAVSVLKKEGMQTAYLTTDDWRIPAIKSYLKAGFEPDLESEADFKERWKKIYSMID